MNIVLLSSIRNNLCQALCIFFYLFLMCISNWEIKVNTFQNEVMHSSKIISLPDFHLQIKIEEQNLLLQQRNSLCSFSYNRRGWGCLFKHLETNIWLHREGQITEKYQFKKWKQEVTASIWEKKKKKISTEIIQLILKQVLPRLDNNTRTLTGCILRGTQ